MNKNNNKFLFAISLLILSLNSCGSSPSPTAIPQESPPTLAQPTITIASPTSTPQGETIIVTSADDNGPGTFRQALLDVKSGYTITFDSAIFPPNNPVAIYLSSELPHISQGDLTIDASDAGVILDASNILEGERISGLTIVSDGNTIRGLQIINFTGSGIAVCGDSNTNNTIGGDRRIGKGPIGQGNLTSNNGLGIDLCDLGSHNTVTGNIIGTDPSTTENWGNLGPGIWIENGLNHNKIGPDNIIAHNVLGIRITGSDTFGNTITQNSIYDNNSLGIQLLDRGNIMLDSPQIFSFDLAMGSVTGTACANCIVEIYSDSSNEGKVFEGQTKTDGFGAFTYEHGVSFTGPYLTATATDADGTTSEFSFVITHAMRLQEGNTHASVKLQYKPSNELEDNRLGSDLTDFYQAGQFQDPIDQDIAVGLKHEKMTINELEYFSNTIVPRHLDWSNPELSIPPEFDKYVTDLVSNDIIITYNLIFWDKANHPEGWEVPSRFKTEEEISRYLEYVRFIVSHFKGRVRYYELWNEPDTGFPLQYIEPADYINLAKRTISVIKEIDPEAKIIVGSVSGTVGWDVQEYLFKILNSDLMLIADAVSWHPLYGNTPDSEQNPEYYANYPSLLAEIMSTAKRNGFQGEFIASEISYNSTGCVGCGINDPFFSDIVSAKYTARGHILHLGNGVSSHGVGLASERPFHNNMIRNIANIFAGASAEAFAVEIQTDAQNIKTFTFTKTDGSKLVVIWTDGVALEIDSGMLATLSIPSISAGEVAGIDVLYGFEQEMITSTEDGNLVIQNLLIKDYPVILRITESSSP